MIVVVAGEDDAESARLADRPGVVRVTPCDLSSCGWAAGIGCGRARFVAGGQPMATRAIRAVLVRLPVVRAGDLAHFTPGDRDYAAAEMTAFLAFWLTTLPVRVVNRPSPTLLLGPGWSPAEWIARSAALGLPTAEVVETAAGPAGPPPVLTWSTVVGGRAFGGEPEAGRHALALARYARVDLLGVGFDGAQVAAVTLRPSLYEPDIVEAAFALLEAA